ncbi:MAG: CBS domain-containing protein, partial [Anaerolinea sp.]|nr:CBS domain-containing protein [Anaerolinea sp.]
KTSLHAAFVIDEYGALLGMVTVQDLLEAIVGDDDREAAVQRDDGSWLLDGRIDLQEMRELLQIGEPIEGEGDDFNTLGGFIMSHQGRIPVAGDVFEWNGFRIEVVDMDGHRVDKVLIARLPPPAAPSSEDAD